MVAPKLPLYCDAVFVMLFNEDNHCRLLISLLNAMLQLPRGLRIVGLDIISPREMGRTVREKHVVMDIRAVAADGRRFNVEVQVAYFSDYPQRILYYWAGMYHGQLQVGQSYGRLKPAYALHITGFNLFPERKRYHYIFQLRDHLEPDLVLTDHEQIHVVELPKFKVPLEGLRTAAEKWIYYIKCGHQMTPDEVTQLAMPELLEAEEKLVMISQEERLRIQHEQWEKMERDRLSYEQDWQEHWKREGMLKGLKEGKDLGLKEGKDLGLKEGKWEGMALSILTILEGRGLPVSPEQRRLLLQRRDESGLKADLLRAGHVSSVEELLST